MKRIFVIFALAATLVGCAKEDIVREAPRQAIGFGNMFVENSTRATDPSFNGDNKLTEFQVWGTANSVAIYEGQDVEGQVGAGSIWTCTKKNYWIEGVTYNFAAVANGTVESLSNGLPATIAYTANGTSDLIYAENKGIVGKAAGSNNPVEFTFNHLLAKAKFTVTTNTSVEGYQYEITNIKIANAYASGIYTVGGSWGTLVVAQDGQAFDSITVNSTNQTAECANEKLLIPIENVVVSYTVTLKYNDGQIWSETKTHNLDNDLAAANSYNFKITVNVGEEIKFNVEKDPTWTATDDTTITL